MEISTVRHAFLFLALIALPSAVADTLKIEGVIGSGEVVMMIDAQITEHRCANDKVFKVSGVSNEIALENFRPPSSRCRSEIAIFSQDNAMFLESPTWTSAPSDIYTAKLKPAIRIPVSVWIAKPEARVLAEKHLERANVLYKNNRVGVWFDPTFEDVSGDPTAVKDILAGIAFTDDGNDYQCVDLDRVRGSRSYTAKTLNVYYVDMDITGRNCALMRTPPPEECPNPTNQPKGDGNINYIGNKADLVALAHEFGHAFGLRPGPKRCGGHVNDRRPFTKRNIMWVSGVPEQDAQRDTFTLGQVFRMNTQTDDWNGTMLIHNGQRPDLNRRCPPLKRNRECPALSKDLPRR